MIGILGKIINDKRKTIGYVLVDSNTGNIIRLSKKDTQEAILKNRFQFMNVIVNEGEISILGLNKLNIYNESGQLISSNYGKRKCSALALKKFVDINSNCLGYKLIDAYGRVKDVNKVQLLSLYGSGIDIINLRIYGNNVGLSRFCKIDTELVNVKDTKKILVTKDDNKDNKVTKEDKIKLYKKLAGRYATTMFKGQADGYIAQYKTFSDYLSNKSSKVDLMIHHVAVSLKNALKAVYKNRYGERYAYHYKHGLKALQNEYGKNISIAAKKLMYMDSLMRNKAYTKEDIIIYREYLKDFIRYRFYMILRVLSTNNSGDILKIKALISNNKDIVEMLDSNINTDEQFYKCAEFVKKLESLINY